MQHVLTLIAPPSTAKLRARMAFVNRMRAALNPVRTVWLSEDACDFLLEDLPSYESQSYIKAEAAAEKIDTILQPIAGRRKRFLIADMDSTMIGQECIDELAAALGIKPQVSEITDRAMRGELDFSNALRERVALLKGLNQEDLERTYRERITLMPGAKTLVTTMRRQGAKAWLVSGGFTFFTSRIAKRIGFDHAEANRLVIEEGKLTGEVAAPILGKEAKQAALLRAAAANRLPLSATLAVGDGANDLPMLLTAGLGVAYHAKPAVEAAAPATIRYNDLTALLYLQGISKSDWIQA